jgi:hypothetical protein
MPSMKQSLQQSYKDAGYFTSCAIAYQEESGNVAELEKWYCGKVIKKGEHHLNSRSNQQEHPYT